MTRYRVIGLMAVAAGMFVWGLAVPAQAQDYGDSQFFDVVAISPTDAWAVGSTLAPNLHWRTLTQHWNGSAWTAVASPNPQPNRDELAAVDASSSTNVWAVGSARNAKGERPLVLRREAGAWKQVAVPVPAKQQMYATDVAVTAPNQVWLLANRLSAKGNELGAAVLRWKGSGWKTLAAPNIDVACVLAAAPGAGVWISGFNEMPYPHKPITERWTSSGWSKVTPPMVAGRSTFISAIAIRGPDDVVAVGTSWKDEASDLDPRWYFLRYHKDSWKVERDGGHGSLAGAAVVSGGQVVAVGQSRPLYTNAIVDRSAAGWDRVSTPCIEESYLNGIDATGPKDLWAVGWQEQGDKPLILHGDGTSWAKVPAAPLPY